MKRRETLQEKIDRVVQEKIDIVAYDPHWAELYKEESSFLSVKFPDVIKRVEHFGSTAVPGLSAKPTVDMLVEVTSLDKVKKEIVPVLEELGYDYFWRPEFDKPPMYAWFIKRDKKGNRTHHIHMVEHDSKLWDRLYFRDYLISHPDEAKSYEDLKRELSEKYPNDRERYTKYKTSFVVRVTKKAKKELKA